MSAFYDLASLVLVPSGYKASKVYAQKPLTADGQLTFSRSTTATRVNSAGLIEEVAANVPRLDYAPTLGQSGVSCPRLLLEPQATSLILFSEQMDNAAWTKSNLTVTANQSASPTGYSDADSLAEQAVNGIHFAGQGITSAAAGTYTFSCFLKQGTTQYGGFRAVVNGFTNRYFVLLDLSNGSVVNTNTTASGVTWTHKVDDYGNGWYRLSVTAAHTSGNIDISISTSDTATPTYFGGLPTYLGTNKFIYAWGANITATSYLQSYIPTLGAAVTRLADACSKTGISSLIGQTEGTLFMEVGTIQAVSNNLQLFGIDDTTSSNRIEIGVNSSNQLYLYAQQGGNTIFENNMVVFTNNSKIAVAYKANSWAVYVNGVKEYENNSANWAVPASAFRLIGRYDGAGVQKNTVAQALVFKTRLTNAQLAELTTL